MYVALLKTVETMCGINVQEVIILDILMWRNMEVRAIA